MWAQLNSTHSVARRAICSWGQEKGLFFELFPHPYLADWLTGSSWSLDRQRQQQRSQKKGRVSASHGQEPSVRCTSNEQLSLEHYYLTGLRVIPLLSPDRERSEAVWIYWLSICTAKKSVATQLGIQHEEWNMNKSKTRKNVSKSVVRGFHYCLEWQLGIKAGTEHRAVADKRKEERIEGLHQKEEKRVLMNEKLERRKKRKKTYTRGDGKSLSPISELCACTCTLLALFSFSFLMKGSKIISNLY